MARRSAARACTGAVRTGYVHGLLTALPLSLLDSYREIARVLLVVYGVLILASAWVMWRTFGGPARDLTLLALVVSSSLLFYPTLVAYVAREFEVLLLFATVMLFAASHSGRQWQVGAWTAYLSLFYLPGILLLLGVVLYEYTKGSRGSSGSISSSG